MNIIIFNIGSVDLDSTFGWEVEPLEKLNDGRLPTTRSSNKCDFMTFLNS
jgi:hypothetical protein